MFIALGVAARVMASELSAKGDKATAPYKKCCKGHCKSWGYC